MMRHVRIAALRVLRAVGLFNVARMLTRSEARILCYHGFSYLDEHKFAPQLFMAPATFQKRLTAIAAHGFSVVPLQELIRRIESKESLANLLVITVDDGWKGNFGMGSHGNLLANVDLITGEVGTVIGGFWPRTEVFLKHPVSGVAFSGFRLPGWSRILEICQAGGMVFPLMKIHHWDFALTDQGPMIMELNDLGGTQIAQMHGHGLLTEETREFLKRHANAQAHPWVRAL